MADVAVLFPGGTAGTGGALLVSRIEGLGHTVNLFAYDIQPDDTGLLSNDAVVFSAQGFGPTVQDGFWDCPLPILAHGRIGHNISTLGMADATSGSSGSSGTDVEFNTDGTFNDTTGAAYEGLRGSFSANTDITAATASFGGRAIASGTFQGADIAQVLRLSGTSDRWGVAVFEGGEITDFSGPTTISAPSSRVHFASPQSESSYDLLTEDGWVVFVDLPLAWLDLDGDPGDPEPTHVRTIRTVSQSGTLT